MKRLLIKCCTYTYIHIAYLHQINVDTFVTSIIFVSGYTKIFVCLLFYLLHRYSAHILYSNDISNTGYSSVLERINIFKIIRI